MLNFPCGTNESEDVQDDDIPEAYITDRLKAIARTIFEDCELVDVVSFGKKGIVVPYSGANCPIEQCTFVRAELKSFGGQTRLEAIEVDNRAAIAIEPDADILDIDTSDPARLFLKYGDIW